MFIKNSCIYKHCYKEQNELRKSNQSITSYTQAANALISEPSLGREPSEFQFRLFMHITRFLLFLLLCLRFELNSFGHKSSQRLTLCFLHLFLGGSHIDFSFNRSFLRLHIWVSLGGIKALLLSSFLLRTAACFASIVFVFCHSFCLSTSLLTTLWNLMNTGCGPALHVLPAQWR